MGNTLLRRVAAIVLGLAVLFPGAAWAVDVFVTLPPQKWVVDNVIAERGTVSVLVKDGQDPHTFEPTPRQIAALSKAKIWFTLDMPFEKRLESKVAQVAPDLQIIDMSAGIEKIEMHDEHGHDEHGHDDHHGEEAEDPHVWLSPAKLQVMAKNAATALSLADAGNKSLYERNLEVVVDELAALLVRLKEQLAPYEGSSFYVFHPSFGYFAHEFGLHQEAVEVDGKSPGPRQIAALVEKARQDQVQVIFVQPQFDKKSAETVAAALDGEVVALDALAEDVISNLRVMGDKIERALGDRETP